MPSFSPTTGETALPPKAAVQANADVGAARFGPKGIGRVIASVLRAMTNKVNVAGAGVLDVSKSRYIPKTKKRKHRSPEHRTFRGRLYLLDQEQGRPRYLQAFSEVWDTEENPFPEASLPTGRLVKEIHGPTRAAIRDGLNKAREELGVLAAGSWSRIQG